MLVTTSAPIVEETSNANGKKKKGAFKKKASETFKKGYTRVKEAGALPVIENLLGLNQGTPTATGTDFMPPPPPPPAPTGMSTTTKVVIGVLVVGAIVGGYLYFKKSKGKKAVTKK
jgi:hypothetical protein